MTTPKTLVVKPAEGLLFRIPGRKGYVPAEGVEVTDSVFIRRRLEDGSLVEVKPEKKAAKKAASKPAEPKTPNPDA